MSKSYDILVIDDEQVVSDAVLKICSSEGFKVDRSATAEEGLDKIKTNNYKLIICDIMLPEKDGFAILEELNLNKINTPIIMTTGFSTVENAVRSLNNGAIDFIPKPFTADELINPIYRGFKYMEIQNQISKTSFDKNDTSIIYVPCPAKYYRLGYGAWVSVEHSGSVLIGLTDLFLKTIDNFNNIELQKEEEEIIQGTSCGQILTEDNKFHNILSPISGRIIEVNNKIIQEKSIIEKDPYFDGWLYRIIPSDLEYELKHLIPCSSDRL